MILYLLKNSLTVKNKTKQKKQPARTNSCEIQGSEQEMTKMFDGKNFCAEYK